MRWDEARDETLNTWRRIRASIGEASDVDLLTEINAVCALCERAEEEQHAHGEEGSRCDYCVAFQQFGGCYGATREMSERVAMGDLDGLRELVDDFIGRLQAIELSDPS